MLNYLKAIIAAIVGAALFWVKTKFNIDLGAGAETAIVAAIMGFVVYLVPNLKPADGG